MNSTALVANILPGTDTLCRCVQAIRTGLLERYTPIFNAMRGGGNLQWSKDGPCASRSISLRHQCLKLRLECKVEAENPTTVVPLGRLALRPCLASNCFEVNGHPTDPRSLVQRT
jgi:hypothetical protein